MAGPCTLPGDMSFIRLLALSYLAWALVFVVTATLMAHLPLPEGTNQGARSAVAQKAGKAVAQVDLAPEATVPRPLGPRAWVPLDLPSPQPPLAQEPKQKPSEAIQAPPKVIPPDRPKPSAPLQVALNTKRIALPPKVIPSNQPKPSAPPHVAMNAKRVVAPTFRIPDPPSDAFLPDLPKRPAPLRVAKNKQSRAMPAFHIPDPPPDAVANLPNLPKHPAPSRIARNKRHSTTPIFHIPDPPPLDAPIFGHAEHV